MIAKKNIRVLTTISRAENKKLKRRAKKKGVSVSKHIATLIREDLEGD